MWRSLTLHTIIGLLFFDSRFLFIQNMLSILGLIKSVLNKFLLELDTYFERGSIRGFNQIHWLCNCPYMGVNDSLQKHFQIKLFQAATAISG